MERDKKCSQDHSLDFVMNLPFCFKGTCEVGLIFATNEGSNHISILFSIVLNCFFLMTIMCLDQLI